MWARLKRSLGVASCCQLFVARIYWCELDDEVSMSAEHGLIQQWLLSSSLHLERTWTDTSSRRHKWLDYCLTNTSRQQHHEDFLKGKTSPSAQSNKLHFSGTLRKSPSPLDHIQILGSSHLSWLWWPHHWTQYKQSLMRRPKQTLSVLTVLVYLIEHHF